MSKNELEKLLEAYIPGTGEDWKQSILDVMVAAYNRGIDDAYDNVNDNCEVWCRLRKDWDDELLKLKI